MFRAQFQLWPILRGVGAALPSALCDLWRPHCVLWHFLPWLGAQAGAASTVEARPRAAGNQVRFEGRLCCCGVCASVYTFACIASSIPPAVRFFFFFVFLLYLSHFIMSTGFISTKFFQKKHCQTLVKSCLGHDNGIILFTLHLVALPRFCNLHPNQCNCFGPLALGI